ncbi:hypothetical protein L209DRAFT_147244 [Thermothelomyces heterothallicus CBS 203.75]
MSSRFVSAGAINAATGQEVSSSLPNQPASSATQQQQQQQQSSQEKSLYEILQANKAAKQAAFEEAHRLRNQFRPLDDDEVEFLDEVRMRKRREEEEARREVERGLAAFREAQRRSGSGSGGGGGGSEEEAEAGSDGEGPLSVGGAFGFGVVGRKRRKGDAGKEKKRLRGVGVIKRASTGGSDGGGGDGVSHERQDVEDKAGKAGGREESVGSKGEASEKGVVAGEPDAGARAEGSTAAAVAKVEAPEAAPATTPTPASSASGAPPSTSTSKSGGLLVDYSSEDDED